MKKILLLPLLLMPVFFIYGCVSEGNQNIENEKINICATIFPQYDFARQITGGRADISMLLPPGSESHSFEPTPQDIVNIQNADVFIYTGGASDSWLDEILKTVDTTDMKIVSLTDVCETVEKKITEGMQTEEHHHGNESEHQKDEHVWTAPKNAVLICDAILKAVCEVDSENTEYYAKNHRTYTEELLEYDGKFRDMVSTAKRKTLVFADRFPFRYFADEYGLDYYAAFSGCAEETEASISTVAYLIEKVKAEGIPVVFYLEFSDRRLADTVSSETGAKPLMLHSYHNVTREEFESGITYTALMQKNLTAFQEALN